MIITSQQLQAAEEKTQHLLNQAIVLNAFNTTPDTIINAEKSARNASDQLALHIQSCPSTPSRTIYAIPLHLRIQFHWASQKLGLPEIILPICILAISVLLIVGVAIALNMQPLTALSMLLITTFALLPTLILNIQLYDLKYAVTKVTEFKNEAARYDVIYGELLNNLTQSKNNLANLQAADRALAAYEKARRETDQLHAFFDERKELLRNTKWRDLRGVQFEKFLKQLLETNGFEVMETKTTGDQGIDLIAVFKSHRIAIQVKGYAGSVGNSAVQEAYSGMAFYRCDQCSVITNSTFTQSAQALASRTGCHLVCGSDIQALLDGKNNFHSVFGLLAFAS